jgi:hypothetical protein
MEDYGFEYSDEEPEEQDVDIENQYYNSKGKYFSFFIFSRFLWIPYSSISTLCRNLDSFSYDVVVGTFKRFIVIITKAFFFPSSLITCLLGLFLFVGYVCFPW